VVVEGDDPDQGVFDFESGNMDGFQNWRRDQERRLEAIRREWSLPIGRRVRVRLRSMERDLEGRLLLAHHPITIDRRVPLRLRIDQVEIVIPDIERCVVID